MSAMDFLSGAAMATFGAAGVFFLRFWKASHDRFYLLFAVACWLLALERVALLVVRDATSSIRTPVTESSSWIYLLRLAAYVGILVAVVDKNRRPAGDRSRGASPDSRLA